MRQRDGEPEAEDRAKGSSKEASILSEILQIQVPPNRKTISAARSHGFAPGS